MLNSMAIGDHIELEWDDNAAILRLLNVRLREERVEHGDDGDGIVLHIGSDGVQVADAVELHLTAYDALRLSEEIDRVFAAHDW